MKKIVLVTGGSRGIGKATCLELAKKGFYVLVNYNTNLDAALNTLSIIENEGGSGELLQFDVTNKQLFNYSGKIKSNDNSIFVSFILNKNYEVFNGHFPDYPIVPGVLEIKVIEDILLDALSIKGELIAASNIKFLKPMSPKDDLEFDCRIHYSFKENSVLECKAKISNSITDYASINCCFEVF